MYLQLNTSTLRHSIEAELQGLSHINVSHPPYQRVNEAI